MTNCNSCGIALLPDSRFCHKCGFDQEQASSSGSSRPVSVSLTLPDWQRAQQATFMRWLNYNLQKCGSRHQVVSLEKDLCDGTLLCQLAQHWKAQRSAGSSTPRIWQDLTLPKDKFKAIENATTFLSEFRSLFPDVKITLGPSNVVDGDHLPLMGLIWQMVQAVQLDVNDFTSDAEPPKRNLGGARPQRRTIAIQKAGILEWVKERVKPYGVQVDDLSESFRDGRAFLALAASYDPSLNFATLSTSDRIADLNRAFAEFERMGIPPLLEAETVGSDDPSLVTYLSVIQNELGSGSPPTGPPAGPSSSSVPVPTPPVPASAQTIPVGQDVSIVIGVKNPPADITFQVKDPNGQLLVPMVERLPNDEFKITFRPTITGPYQVLCTANGRANEVATFAAIQAQAASSSTSAPPAPQVVSCDQEVSFVVTITNPPADIRFRVHDPTGQLLEPRVEKLPVDQFKISFIPKQPGTHTVDCLLRGTPTTLVTLSAQPSESSHTLIVGQQATFFWTVLSGSSSSRIIVLDPNGRQVPSTVEHLSDNRFKFAFTPAIPGEYRPQTTDGVMMTPVTAIHPPAASGSYGNRVEVVGQPATFIVTVQNMTELPQFRVLDPTRKIFVKRDVEQLGPDQVKITFVPLTPGEYEIQTAKGMKVAVISAV